MNAVPAELRARLAADYRPVHALPGPWARVLWLMPFAALTFLAAPVVFWVRADAATLGWLSWGASLVQVAVGLTVAGAALRESVPGRGWSRAAIALWLVIPILMVVGVTIASWQASPVLVRGGWWLVGLMCFAASAASALPVVALASVLAARAYPTRPAIAGALLGLGAGLMADAGWRIFCHFSEPAHVLSAHLAAVVMSAILGSVIAVRLRTLSR
jgi:hypothetical protein